MKRLKPKRHQPRGSASSVEARPTAEALWGHGNELWRLGRLAEAVEAYESALRINPEFVEAHANRSVALRDLGRANDASAAARSAICVNPGYAEAYSNRGNALMDLGHLASALALHDWALRVGPDQAEAHINRGVALQSLGRYTEALAAQNRAILIRPALLEGHFNRGVVLRELGRQVAAIGAYDLVIRLKPGHPEAYCNRGNALQDIGCLGEALADFQTALRFKPYFAAAHYNRGNALKELRSLPEAVAAYNAAIALLPDYAEAYSNLGVALHDLGRFADAIRRFDSGIRLRPDLVAAEINRGNSLKEMGLTLDALDAYDRAICFSPDLTAAHSNRGAALHDLGRIDEAIGAFDAAIALKPDHAEANSNRLMVLHYAECDPATLLAASQEFSARFEREAPPDFVHDADPDRRLRIGYVSGDLGRHPVGYFLAPSLTHHDPGAVEVFCYATYPRDDSLTARLREGADHWRSLVGVSDADAAAMIRADRIDILVDLSGHTAHNRLPLFALRPAPVQVSWLGFWGTTGLKAMDYILSDAVTIPAGDEDQYSETVMRLSPSRFCYAPPDYAPEPCLREGAGVTFGSFNNLAKVGPEVVSLWSEVLRAVPGSRLLLKWRSLADVRMRDRLVTSFAAHGIGAERLVLRGGSPHEAMLAEYGDVDIALDPFPFSGGLTSCEALWMGVPVVTLPGTAAPSRQTLGFLRVLGHEDWAAKDRADYVRIAAGLAADRTRLAELRRSLRPTMASSALCDGVAFARRLEQAYKTMWRNKNGIGSPGVADDLFRLAIAHHKSGRLTDAEQLYRQVIAADECHSDAIHLLGAIAYQAGRADIALEWIDRAISLNGGIADYHSNRGLALQSLGRTDEAVAAFDKTISLNPEHAEAHSNRGVVLLELGHGREARQAWELALALVPDDAKVLANQGVVLKTTGCLREALAASDRAIAVRPDSIEAHLNRGNVLIELGRPMDAVAACRIALCLKPDLALAYSNCGMAYNDVALFGSAAEAFGRTIRLQPNDTGAYSNLLFCLQYQDGVSDAEILSHARAFAAQFETGSRRDFDNSRDPARRLRIGYVSGDLRRHSVSYFLGPLLAHHDRSQVEVFCYSNGIHEDEVTAELRSSSDHWRSLVGLSDQAAADLIGGDGIDILVDLSGHTAGNRLTLFALKPAPVQVTWLGYPGTTGLSSVDYRLVDSLTDPEGLSETSERLVQLDPGFLCYGPPAEAPEPARTAGEGIRFGSFNNPAKLSLGTLDLWSTLLQRVEGSRLVLKGRPFADEGARALLLERFAERGIGAERIELLGHTRGAAEHLAAYGEIDIALDPFPYNGTTTTCEALWMGVPVVTLAGQRHSGRVGVSLLTQVGLEELIAQHEEDYLRIAADLAATPERLAQMRTSLRPLMAASSLCDGAAFARRIEEAYRRMSENLSNETMPGGKVFLHVGCGPAYKDSTTRTFAGPDWRELRLDINPVVKPDIVGTMTEMSAVPSESVDALYSSHNIEHLYAHEVPAALAEFLRVLRPGGFVVITCPDLQSVAQLVAEDKLTETAYMSPAGPIAPIDILYGYRPEMAAGNLYMAHRCGFTRRVLEATLAGAGFKSVATCSRGAPIFDLWAVATKEQASADHLRGLAREHFPDIGAI